VTRDFLLELTPKTLRDLAGAMEGRTAAAEARRSLTPAGVDRLADILLAGSTPTVGFFIRYRAVP
jgi:hypothetical protein